ncbi:MAG: metallophosphoesterase [Methylomarinum sp.]|nr:metallophosphoesterase [Methylomarinum sp.]
MSDEKRILFAGDPHGDFEPIIAAVETHQPEAVVLLGDYELKEPLEECLKAIKDKTQIWWIPGNHDFDMPSHHHNLFNSQLAGRGLHLKVKEIAGLRIAGLGGIFLGRVWYPPRTPKWQSKQHYLSSLSANNESEQLSLKYQSAIWYDEWTALKKLKADILVTHEAPRSHKHGFIAIDQLAEAMGVCKVFHGHLHEHYSSVIRKGIQVFGVENVKVVDLQGNNV